MINIFNDNLDFMPPDSYNIRIINNVECFEHIHFHIEILVITRGMLTLKCEKTEYTLAEGSAAVIMPYEIHGFKYASDETQTLIIEFNPLMFPELSSHTCSRSIRGSLTPYCLTFAKSVAERDFASIILTKSLVYAILDSLFSKYDDKAYSSNNFEIYKEALGYIDKNFCEHINLRSAALAIGCSYVYLSRIFSKSAGMSFTTYLNRYRIINSLSDLKCTDITITEIAFKYGFGSLRSYNREFKKCLSTTPNEYRIHGYKYLISG